MKTNLILFLFPLLFGFSSCTKKSTNSQSQSVTVGQDSLKPFFANINGQPFNFISLHGSQQMNTLELKGENDSATVVLTITAAQAGAYAISTGGPTRLSYKNAEGTFYCSSGTVNIISYFEGSPKKGKFSGSGTMIQNGISVPLSITNGEFSRE